MVIIEKQLSLPHQHLMAMQPPERHLAGNGFLKY